MAGAVGGSVSVFWSVFVASFAEIREYCMSTYGVAFGGVCFHRHKLEVVDVVVLRIAVFMIYHAIPWEVKKIVVQGVDEAMHLGFAGWLAFSTDES